MVHNIKVKFYTLVVLTAELKGFPEVHGGKHYFGSNSVEECKKCCVTILLFMGEFSPVY